MVVVVGGSGGFEVGEGRDGERRRAGYSAAASRPADSAFSPSERATGGRQKNGVEKKRADRRLYATVRACVSVQMSFCCHLGKD